MSILGKIKKGVENSGSSKGKILYTKDGSKVRVRFLHDVEDAFEIKLHDHYDNGVNALCQELLDKKCPYCDQEGDGWRHRDGYVWSVWDYDAKEVKLFLGHANNFSPLPQLIGMAEAYGNWTDRDYVISQTGKQMSKTYSVVPMDKVKFKNPKAKPFTKKALLDLLEKAYPVNETDKVAEKNGKKKSKKKVEEEPEDDEEDENEYESMSPRELYMECIERGLEGVKKKQKAKYYIELLEADDEDSDEDEDEWEDGDDEEDEDGEW